jgi:ABC-2 type transport system permease protein
LTQTLRSFEQGLLSAGLVMGIVAVIGGLAALSTVWLPPGVPMRVKLVRAVACTVLTIFALGIAAQIRTSVDVSEDRRNSFASSDQKLLATLRLPLVITVNLAPEDPRYIDLRRNVLGKLERAMPNISIVLAGNRQDQAGQSDAYGEIEYVYDGRSDVSRSTSPREILPLLYGLAGTQPPAPIPGADYPGYPLVANADAALLWFFCGLPLLIALAWWRSRQPPAVKSPELEGGQP